MQCGFAHCRGVCAGDPFPLYRWNDSRVVSLCKVVDLALASFNKTYSELLNIIVRIYRPGDTLNFHTDRENFTESVYGIVLENHDPSRGLILGNKSSSKAVMLAERAGTVWALSDEARYEWVHGYCTAAPSGAVTGAGGSGVRVRTSITFRFFKDNKSIPSKPFQPDLASASAAAGATAAAPAAAAAAAN